MVQTNLFTVAGNLSALGGFPLGSPRPDLRLSARTKRGPRLWGRAPGIKLSSAVAAARIHMDIKGSDAGLCVGNSDAQGIT